MENKIPIELSQLSPYEKWSLDFFSNPKHVFNPYLNICLQLDITGIQDIYKSSYQNEFSTFTSYLTWKLLQTIKDFPTFSYRKCPESNSWYYYPKMPLIFPVALENKSHRYNEVIIINDHFDNWTKFSKDYRIKIQETRNADANRNIIDEKTWTLSHYIGNLPHLQFTNFTPHTSFPILGKPSFYFGKRYTNNAENKHLIPLSITFDHSTTDPYIINQLIESYSCQLAK